MHLNALLRLHRQSISSFGACGNMGFTLLMLGILVRPDLFQKRGLPWCYCQGTEHTSPVSSFQSNSNHSTSSIKGYNKSTTEDLRKRNARQHSWTFWLFASKMSRLTAFTSSKTYQTISIYRYQTPSMEKITLWPSLESALSKTHRNREQHGNSMGTGIKRAKSLSPQMKVIRCSV